ncbi:hypothetical protein AAE478_010141 [Parahypoxylon ruwenzoriense]
MTSLAKTAIRPLALAPRVAIPPASRKFSTSIAAQKSVTEAAKDTLKSVDRKVSDKLVEGINVGANLAAKVRGEADTNKVKGTAEEIRGQMKGETEELKGKAKGAAKEAEGKIKGTL